MNNTEQFNSEWKDGAFSETASEKLELLRQEFNAHQRIMAQVFEHIGEAIVITDVDNRIIATNGAFSRLTGYAQDEVLGQNPRLLQSGRESREFYAEMWNTLLSRDYWQGEIWDKRKDGSQYPKLLSITVVRNEKGQIINYIGGFYDITERSEAERAIERLAHIDSLTSLPNRFSFTVWLAQTLEHARRSDENLAVMFIDLDHFKDINDTLGHQIGDELLREAAIRLKELVRGSDVVARLGGDEFVVVLTGIEENCNAGYVADKILASFSRPFTIDCHELFSSLSIGISVFPENGTSLDDLLKKADMAMYHAKASGRNNYQYFTEKMQHAVHERLSMERALRLAVERKEFFLLYQPQLCLATGQVIGVEALVRWQNPELGLVMPNSFIPLAEETGLIVEIGEWVLKTACQQNKAWQDAGHPPFTVAVNLSARQFAQVNICDVVANALQESGLDPVWLELEITESMVMHNIHWVMTTLNKLKEMGMLLAMDDFGTGYSSLSYLRRFPFDKLKIDQSFVRDITSNPDNAAIAKAVIALAHTLRLKVIAEGVETEGQLNYLRMNGCDEIQGYYFGYPQSSTELEQMLRDYSPKKPLPGDDGAPLRTVLVVDDEKDVGLALQRQLNLEGYDVLLATSAAEGFEVLANNRVGVVISDQRMPVMTGAEFLGRVKELHPDVVRITLTGYADLQSVTEAVNRGAIYKFLTKPWENDVICDTVADAFRSFEKHKGGR